MSGYRHYKNSGVSGQWVFVTTTCLDFVHAFRSPEIKDTMAASLVDDCLYYGAALHAFVVMPHHIHFIVQGPSGKTLAWLIQRIKSNSARRILPLLPNLITSQFDQQRGLNARSFWQRSFRSFIVSSEAIFWQKVGYIHTNPCDPGW